VPALITVDSPAIVVESVKLADDRSGDVVVRLYESLGGRATGTLRTGFPLAGVSAVDLLERPLPEPPAASRLDRPQPQPETPAAAQPEPPAAARPAGAVPVVIGPGGEVAVSMRAFQIVTLRLSPAAPPGA
jgi:alpha-mannosidase